MMSQYNQQTSLGLPEWVERVGAYAGLWVTGLILLFIERRNQTVRHHARQSLLIFGILSLIGFVAWFVGGVFHVIPLLGGLLAAPFVLISGLVGTITFILWIVLMVAAGFFPQFRIPGTQRVERLLR